MSKNGKLKKAKNVEKRLLQMQEAMECLPLKEAAQSDPLPSTPLQEHEGLQPVSPLRKPPKQCTFPPCGRYLDPSCQVCPYCGTPLPD